VNTAAYPGALFGQVWGTGKEPYARARSLSA